MAWIESHASLYEHPKTRKAAKALGVSVPTVMGHLHCLWHWALTHAEDGDFSGLDHVEIAYAAKWDGDPIELVNALSDCGKRPGSGFLDRDGKDLSLHDWDDYAGKLMAQRVASRERARTSRKRARSVRAGAHIQDRTVPNTTSTPLTPQGGDGSGPSGVHPVNPEEGIDEFERCWAAHRDAGASMGVKRTNGRGNCAWRQWGRLLASSRLTPAEAAGRWIRLLGSRGRFTPQPQRILRPENMMLTDESLSDAELNAKARGGQVASDDGEKQRKVKLAEIEGKHNHLEGVIRESGPRPDLVERLNRYRELLGWEPKQFGDRPVGDNGDVFDKLRGMAT